MTYRFLSGNTFIPIGPDLVYPAIHDAAELPARERDLPPGVGGPAQGTQRAADPAQADQVRGSQLVADLKENLLGQPEQR